MGARPVAGRARPPSATLAAVLLSSRPSPSRRPAPSPAPFLLSLVPSSSRPRPRPRPRHFLIFSYLITWRPARHSHAIRAPVPAEPARFRTLFDDKMAVVDLLTPRFGSYKVIFVSPFPSVGLVFRFVSVSRTTSTRHFLFLPVSTMDAVKNLFTSKAPARSIGLAAVTIAITATSVGGSGSPGSPGSLQSRFKAQTAHLRDIQRAQRPKNTQRAYGLR